MAQVIGHELGHTMDLGENAGDMMVVPPYVDCNNSSISSFLGRASQTDANNTANCSKQIIQQGSHYNGGEQSTTE